MYKRKTKSYSQFDVFYTCFSIQICFVREYHKYLFPRVSCNWCCVSHFIFTLQIVSGSFRRRKTNTKLVFVCASATLFDQTSYVATVKLFSIVRTCQSYIEYWTLVLEINLVYICIGHKSSADGTLFFAKLGWILWST